MKRLMGYPGGYSLYGGGRSTDVTEANVRSRLNVHWIDPAPITHECVNREGEQCFRVAAVSRATGALCLLDAPVTVGSPAAIFRDCPEFKPYITSVGVPWQNISLWHQSVDMSVTTQFRREPDVDSSD